MKNENKIVELLAGMLIRQDGMLDELKNVNIEVTNVKVEVTNVKAEVTNVKAEVSSINTGMIKLNLQPTENTRAIFKLAEKVEQIAVLHSRVTKIENTVYK